MESKSRFTLSANSRKDEEEKILLINTQTHLYARTKGKEFFSLFSTLKIKI